ncbi:amino acid adenylation domain-containing protein [Streptomyces chlorus]|uniref:Amino acid adenylation domain-containing protein n=1 Tax=Streptomyces chlorus TaxID=887452 RepID=A0ABW1DPS5_9ACTN
MTRTPLTPQEETAPSPGDAAASLLDGVAAALHDTFDREVPAGGEPVLPPGADSMTAVRLALALEDRLGVPVPLSLLRAGHDAATLAGLIAEAGGTATAGLRLAVPDDPAGPDEPFPATALQQAYLVGKEDDLVPDAVGCHHYREFDVSGLDVDRLRRAWLAVRRRHPVLDCGLTAAGALRVRPALDLPLTTHPVGHDPSEVRARLGHRRYTAADWPLYEVEVTPGAAGDGRVHLAVDGVLCDGRSLRVLLRDWWRAYDGSPDVLASEPATVSFGDYARAVARESGGERYAADLAHWEKRLAALPAGPGLVRTPAWETGDVGGGPGRRPLTGSLDARAWARLREVAARQEVSATAFVLSTFADVLAGAGAPTPFSLVLTTSDRARMRGAEDTVGTFTSTVVFPVHDTDARAVHERLAEDLDHPTVPGVAALRRRRGPLPDLPVTFTSMIDDGVPEGAFAAAECYAVGRTSGVSLDHQVWEEDGALRYRWDVVERAFEAPGAEALFTAYTARLEALAGSGEPAPPPESEEARGQEPAALAARPEPRAGSLSPAPLNDLQQAYLVSRALGSDDAGGCRLLLSYEVPDLDTDRLWRALERLTARHPVLSARVDAGHGLQLPAVPPSPSVPEVPLVPELVGELVGDLLREAHLWDEGHLDVRVGRAEGSDGAGTVFLTADLALIDARSIHLAGRELMRLYAADGDTGDAPFPGPAGPSAGALDAVAAREHWRRRVAALPPGPRLPTVADDGGRIRLRGTLPGWRTVVAAGAKHGCSPDGLLLAAYARALSPGLGDVFGVPVVRWPDGSDAARPAERTALSWVTVTAEGCPLIDLARRYDAVLAEDREADTVSGLSELRRARRSGPGLAVVYTSLFDLDTHPLPDGVEAGAWATSTPGVALDCVAVQEGDVLEYAWDVLPEQLPEGWPEEAFARFADDLAGLVSLEQTPVDDPDLPPARWNDTARPFPADLPVQVLIEDQARIRPSDVAVRWSGGALSYAELELRANRLAWTLREAGVGRGDVVGVSVRRGPDMVVAVLGILKAGGAYLPVLPSLPSERASVMLADAAAAFLVCDATCGWAASLSGTHGTSSAKDATRAAQDVPELRLVDLDVVLAEPHPREGRAPQPVNEVDDLAYVIFTSGSTGRPKGVGVSHRPMLNLFEWSRRTFGFGPGDLGLCVTSLGFDLSVFDILGLLSLGAALYVADEEQQRDPGLLLRVLETEPVTFWNSAPTTLANLAPEFPTPFGRCGGDTLRLVFLSGDYTPLWLPERLRAAFPGATLVSLGGATEATVWSNYFVVDQVDPGWRSIPYGRPLDNSRYHILDASRRPVPIGAEGDLYIAGDCLALGYYRQPGLTAERFVTGEFPGLPETRLYATGDRARFAPDGVMHFLGRRDGQVKVRGFRVELPEIEHRLRTHPGVADAVVLLRSGGSGEDRLVAYVLPEDRAPRPDRAPAPPLTGAELRAHASAALPDYMVPSVVAFVEEWPTTPNGKLDRDALPWPADSTSVPAPAVERAAPPVPAGRVPGAGVARARERTEVREAAPGAAESGPAGTAPSAVVATGTADVGAAAPAEDVASIAALLGELLDLPPVDPSADLWELGATSFTMVRASRVLRDRYGCEVPVALLLSEPTVAAIAAHLSAASRSQAQPARTEPVGAEHEQPPASRAQRELPRSPRVRPEPAEPRNVRTKLPETPSPREERPEPSHVAPPPRADAPRQAEPRRASPPQQVDFFAVEDRRRFKEGDLGQRPAPEHARPVPLAGGRPSEGQRRWRASRRPVTEGWLDGERLGRLLRVLARTDESAGSGALYPSAGDTYAVQVYVLVRDGAVEGLDAGAYYYRPRTHALEPLGTGTGLPVNAHVYYNRPFAARACAEIYLVGEQQGIEPLYQAQAPRYLALEAGHMAQLLMQQQVPSGVAVCPVGDLRQSDLAETLGLGPSHTFLLGLLCAPLDAAGDEAPGEPLWTAADTPSARQPGEVAVVGMAGRFPGAAGPDELWRMLHEGRSAIGPMAPSRVAALGWTGRPPIGGFLDTLGPVDLRPLRISPAEAAVIDPQLRLLLPAVWQCLEGAGHTPRSLTEDGGRVGVFVASMWDDHLATAGDGWERGDAVEVVATRATLPNRLSHTFGWQGPSLAVDTSCSSSLTALHLAMQALRSGECDSAVVAGVNLVTHRRHVGLLSGLGLLATPDGGTPNGAYDEAAPGWYLGEAVGALLLRRADSAARDGDRVHGVLEASWCAHAGGEGRFGAPGPASLTSSLTDMLRTAGLDPTALSYVESAAAGAGLADATEVSAFAELLAGRDGPVPMGTVKPNIGHAEAAAGLGQLMKVLLQLRHGRIAPTLVSGQPNPLVNWADGPVYVPRRAVDWERSGPPRRALVNAVGSGGSYGHLVVREAEGTR